MKRLIFPAFLFFLFSLFIFDPVLAAMGVGVGTGKIVVEEPLKSGTIYKLPPLSVINTGDVPSDYGVGISHKTIEGKIKPSQDWFTFEPTEFFLNPGESKLVSVKLNIPLKSVPGDYFCFLEGHPVVKSETGQTMIGISAASKLNFTIAPSNIFEGMYYRGLSLWKQNLPWTNIIAGTVLIFIVIRTFSRFININIKLSKKENKIKQDNE